MADLEGITLANQYFLRKRIGSGGMADVYQAWDRGRSTTMAVKVLRDSQDQDPQRLEAFEREATWLSQLKHPYIVRLYEMVRDGETIFLVMDWVEGKDLRKTIDERHKPFDPSEVVRILYPICSALNYSHQEHHVYHCDIKPANILLSQDNKILLTDFGVARISSLKMSGGTPVYMAPEQIMDRPVDARTDIYSLGITIFEMLSGGVLPFRGDSQQSSSKGSTARQRVEWEQCNLSMPPLSQFNPALKTEIIRVVEKALHKDPNQRYTTPLSLWNDLAAVGGDMGKPNSTLPESILTTQPRTVSPGPADTPPPPHAWGQTGRVKGPSLVCRSGQWQNQVIPIQQGKMTIGRRADCTIVVPDPGVSRCHAFILQTPRAVYIQDDGSTAGTYVNGERVLAARALKEGDVIQIGQNWVFEFHR
jgi:serine/threonine protein kinase